ncbi:dTDP-4-dehydrorhamnose 3,5-epimerase [Allopseudospirillum japonicum]|uniref:dTDP-4-dehydrorhamnose 3,5-epimerase n=1 Tax=Allopseudospirillum japonicum TaxID=64971 RepID=A0A1H6ST42_9GAMM|nr:YqcC family protein [Allopseudospirillum japonicum]SEI68944.1 dTDP-4-dehydrorhamnose 3,5-epimerase [Allopseudospirillum japonicum]
MSTCTHAQIASLLQQLKQTLAHAPLDLSAPEAQAFQSEQPFCIDTMYLQQWLAYVFIPRMQALIDAQAPLPEKCTLIPIAEMTWDAQQRADALAPLMSVLAKIDACFAD